MEMTPQRWAYTGAYIHGLFGQQNEQLASLMGRAVAAGLPDIAVSSEVGRLLGMLASLTGGGLALEIGTLGGYSGIWIARGLREGGRLITIESEDSHADFAQREFEVAGVSGRVDLRRGKALEVLPRIAEEAGPGSIDFAFFDAVKSEYPEYFRMVRPLIRTGGVIAVDNALGGGSWWIDEPLGSNDERDGADRLNRVVASDRGFESVVVPMRQGLLVARRLG